MASAHPTLRAPAAVWAFWFCCGIAAGQPAAPAQGSEAVSNPTATTVFFDDFSGTGLDRAKWNVVITGQWVNNEQQAYVDAPEVIRIVHGAEAEGAANGALVLQAVSQPGFVTPNNRRFDFISGRIDTRGKFESASGTWAARIKLPAGAGLWPAFWALGSGRWPDTGEVDIMENVGAADWISAALHGPGYSGNTPLVKRTTLPAGRDATAWHIYSVDWSPEQFLFKVDGETYYEVARPLIEKYGRYAYDNPKFVILNLALGGNYPMSVNGEKGPPHPGLPPATVQLIKDGKARMLVDWVRVTAAARSAAE
jgi:beta-glucanase (GH16 family)